MAEHYTSRSLPHEEQGQGRKLLFFYTEVVSTVSTETLILTGSGLVGAVGGSLGLFLGLSLSSALSAAVDLLAANCQRSPDGTCGPKSLTNS